MYPTPNTVEAYGLAEGIWCLHSSSSTSKLLLPTLLIMERLAEDGTRQIVLLLCSSMLDLKPVSFVCQGWRRRLFLSHAPLMIMRSPPDLNELHVDISQQRVARILHKSRQLGDDGFMDMGAFENAVRLQIALSQLIKENSKMRVGDVVNMLIATIHPNLTESHPMVIRALEDVDKEEFFEQAIYNVISYIQHGWRRLAVDTWCIGNIIHVLKSLPYNPAERYIWNVFKTLLEASP